ncbi:MAG: hypothetical protein AABZ30_11690 [Myxococcota bacterium]
MKHTTVTFGLLLNVACVSAPFAPAAKAYYGPTEADPGLVAEEARVSDVIRATLAERFKPTPELDARLMLSARESLEQGEHDLATEQRYPANGVEWYGASWDGRREVHTKEIDLEGEARKAADAMSKLAGPVFFGVAYGWSTLRQGHDLVIIWDERPVALDKVSKIVETNGTLNVSGRILKQDRRRYSIELGDSKVAIRPYDEGRFNAALTLPAQPGRHLLVVREINSNTFAEKLLLYVGIPTPETPTMTRLDCGKEKPDVDCAL